MDLFVFNNKLTTLSKADLLIDSKSLKYSTLLKKAVGNKKKVARVYKFNHITVCK